LPHRVPPISPSSALSYIF